MHFWLNRTASQPLRDEQGNEISTLAFWKAQADYLLRRVAIRTGGLMVSQSATERGNKVAKEVWTANRRSVTTAHMMEMFSFTQI